MFGMGTGMTTPLWPPAKNRSGRFERFERFETFETFERFETFEKSQAVRADDLP